MDDHSLLFITECLPSPICYNTTKTVYSTTQSTIEQNMDECLNKEVLDGLGDFTIEGKLFKL